MPSGYSQGGAYSAFQHYNVVAPLPVAEPANGNQIIIVAIHSSPPSPSLLELRQHIKNTGFHHPVPRDGTSHFRFQISRKANDFDSSANVSTQHRSNKNAVRHSVYCGGQQKGYSDDFSRHSLERSNLNRTNGLLQNNSASLTGISAAHHGTGTTHQVLAKNSHSQQDCPEVKRHPLLFKLLTGDPNHYQPCLTNTSPSQNTNSNVEVDAIAAPLDERCCRSLHMSSSPPVLCREQIRTQNPDQMDGTSIHQRLVFSPCLSGQPSTENLLEPDDPILAYIAQQCNYFRSQNNRQDEHNQNPTFRSDCTLPDYDPAFSSTVFDKDVKKLRPNCVVVDRCSAAGGEELEDGGSNSKVRAELPPNSKEMGDCTTSASENHSSEYPQLMMNAAVTCTKNEDESPVVPTAVSGMSLDELTQRHPSLFISCSSSPNLQSKPSVDQDPGLSEALEHNGKERGFIAVKPVEAERLGIVQGGTEASKDPPAKSGSKLSEKKTSEIKLGIENHNGNTITGRNIDSQQHCHVACKETDSEPNSALDKIQIHNVVSLLSYQSQQQCGGVRTEAGSVQSQTDLIRAPTKGHTRLSESENIVKLPIYEDISEDDMPTKTPESGMYFNCEDTQREDRHSEFVNFPLAQVPEPNETEDETDDDDDYIVLPIIMMELRSGTEDVDQGSPEENQNIKSQGGSSPTFRALQYSASNLPVYDTVESLMQELKKDNNWIGASISEPNDRSQTEDSHNYSSASVHNYSLPSKESEVKRNQTSQTSSSDKVKCLQNLGALMKKTTEKQRTSKEKPSITEETQDYSLTPEHSYEIPPISMEQYQSASVKESEATNVQMHQTDRSETSNPRKEEGEGVINGESHDGSLTSKQDVIIISSDSEDEWPQNCNKKARRKRSFSGSVDSRGRHSPGTGTEDLPADSPEPHHESKINESQYKETNEKSGHKHRKAKRKRLYVLESDDSGDETIESRIETTNEKCQGSRPSPADGSTLQHQSKCVEAASSDSTHRMQTSDQLVKSKPGFELVQQKTVRETTSKKVERVVPGSKSDTIGKKKAKKVHGTQRRPSAETVDRLSREDPTEKQHQSIERNSPTDSVIPHLVQKNSAPVNRLKPVSERREGKDENRVPKLSAARKKTDDDTAVLFSNKATRFVYKPKPAAERQRESKNSGQADRTNSRFSRQLSLPNLEGPSTSGTFSSTGGHLSEARRSLDSSSATPKPQQSPPNPRPPPSCTLQRSNSCSDHVSTPCDPPSYTYTQPSARERIKQSWRDCNFSGNKKPWSRMRPTYEESQRDPRLARKPHKTPTRQRYRSQDHPRSRLMKQVMSEAKEERNRVKRRTISG